jgi:hypothetical protein
VLARLNKQFLERKAFMSKQNPHDDEYLDDVSLRRKLIEYLARSDDKVAHALLNEITKALASARGDNVLLSAEELETLKEAPRQFRAEKAAV